MPKLRPRPYRVLGPVEIPRGSNRYLEKSDVENFWDAPEQARPGISAAHGVYLFAMRAGGGYTPWYVGKTSRQGGFAEEVFDYHKLYHYNGVLNSYGAGTPVLFLLYPVTPVQGKLRKPPASEVSWVERHMIAVAIEANPRLKNERDTAHQRTVQIPGVLNAPVKGAGISHFLRAVNRWRVTPRPSAADSPIEHDAIFDVEADTNDVDAVISEEIARVPDRRPSKVISFLFGEMIAETLAR